jgi:hypothetical protein
MEMWFGVEPLLSLLVLSLPVVWIIDWRFSSKSSLWNPSKLLNYFLMFLIFLIVFQAVLGHTGSPGHVHAIYWGVSDSFFLACLNFSNGPEGRLLFVAFFYWIYIIIRQQSENPTVTIFSLPLIPLIAIGASAGSFEPISETIVSPHAPLPTIYPLLFSLIGGTILGESMIRTPSLISAQELTVHQSAFTIVLWSSIVLITSLHDSISSLYPSSITFSLIFLTSITILADIIGGISETYSESKGETWPSFWFTFSSFFVALILIYIFSNETNFSKIGILAILAALGSQLPSLGFDNRYRSPHRGGILGIGIGASILVIFSTLDEISMYIIGLTMLLNPLFWDFVDRKYRNP